MIYLPKSDGTQLQPLLDAARNKDDEKVYREGLVYEQIKTDFYGKCYLCEDDEVTSIQIEHFDPHKNDLAKKYDWNNLFYACGHCNNIKGANFWPLLNCTDQTDQVWESIEIHFTPFPKATVKILVSGTCLKQQEAENTRKLLEKALVGKDATAMKKDEALIIRKKMLRAYNQLTIAINKKDDEAIRQAVSDKSAFAGMLLWTLKTEFPEQFEKFCCAGV